ncbi:LINE-1 retrotransposable element ORF2 protein [Symbiodinium microadriaticum]|uniref:LINE-1 retrotransposable element ORF2 protein n=1 Tax=Symbiodinium microadriaticum TaxID=2951 RepID=A0A1Q9DQD8_SYMMI|nr:LINE-1 retrotransposable element ORF2 protein [Symbiodinium microadriaticum]
MAEWNRLATLPHSGLVEWRLGHTMVPVQQAFGGGLDNDCSTWDELYGDEDDENANAWNGPASSTASKKRNAESAFQGPATVLSQVANALIPGAEVILRMNAKGKFTRVDVVAALPNSIVTMTAVGGCFGDDDHDVEVGFLVHGSLGLEDLEIYKFAQLRLMVGGFQDIKVSDDFNMLAQYAETKGLLPETQCGFRPGRGTMDMVFALKLAMEISDYKKHPFHVLFVDLVKAYDSVARAGVWAVLKRKGVPPRIISILRDYYSGEKARISVEGGLSEEFELETGLGQGCCVAPLLFNIFLAAVVEAWVGESGGGVHWLTRIDEALVHREAQDKYSSWEALDLHELGYADDAALIAEKLSQLHGMAKGFQLHLREWGLQLSAEKTEAMSSAPGMHAPIQVEEFEGFDAVKFSKYLEYLGVIIQRNGSGDMAVKERLELAAGGREKLVQTLTADVRERVRTNPEVDMEELCCDLVEGSFQVIGLVLLA